MPKKTLSREELEAKILKIEADVAQLLALREMIVTALKLQKSLQPVQTIALLESIIPLLDQTKENFSGEQHDQD